MNHQNNLSNQLDELFVNLLNRLLVIQLLANQLSDLSKSQISYSLIGLNNVYKGT